MNRYAGNVSPADMWDSLALTDSPVVLYGTGNGADKILDELARRGISVAGVFASSGFVRDRSFRGYKVRSYEECRELFPCMKVLMCFGSSRPEVLENVKRIMSECDFYVPDVPVYGDNIFDSAFYEAHREEFEAVRSALADEKSVKTFDGVVAYKLSGRPERLFECETAEEEADGLIKLPDNASIADFGAYNGDTVKKYALLYPSYSSITAVEPDKRNYAKLCANTADMRNVFPVNALLSDENGDSHIEKAKGRGVHESENGAFVSKVTVDGLFAEHGVDFMKFDVEGAELAALKGAVRTIKKYRPSMLISCYHRSEDIFTLPLELLSVCPEYKLYLRHLPGLPAWDTQFYAVCPDKK